MTGPARLCGLCGAPTCACDNVTVDAAALQLHRAMLLRGWKYIGGEWFEPCPYMHGEDGQCVGDSVKIGCEGTGLRKVTGPP